MSYFDDFVNKVPGSLSARAGVNLRNLIHFFTDAMEDARSLTNTVEAFRSVNNAVGVALDSLGEKYGEQRGQADDEFYRIMIKSKIIVRAGNATVNGILRTIQGSLDVSADDIIVESIRQPIGTAFDPDAEPLAIRISNIPLEIASTEWEQDYLLRRIKSVVAAGIRVDYIQFVDVAGVVVKTITASNSAVVYHNDEPFS